MTRRAKRKALRAAVLLFLLGVALTAMSVAALAAATPVDTPTPTQTPPATETPVVSFDPVTGLPSQEEFFGTDDRTDVADYDSPAYDSEQEDEVNIEGDSYIGNLLRDNADTMDIVVFLTLLSIIPSLLIMLTGFTRIVIVLSFVRNALGTNNMPPNTAIIGLAIFLTLFVMYPIITEIQENALTPYMDEEIPIDIAAERALEPLSRFMLRNTYQTDLAMFIGYSGMDTTGMDLTDETTLLTQIPAHVIIPAFLTSEIKTAFIIGFFIYIPFIVIDMIVASTLMSMGMMMLPPVMIALPFKVLLFVSVNGWQMVIKTLMDSFY